MTEHGVREAEKEYRIVPVASIEVWNEANIRHREITEGIDELAANIKEVGLQQPPVVQEENGKYKLISGQRRLLAIKQLNWKEMPVLVLKRPLNLFEAKILSFSENLHRKNVSENDLAEACAYFKEKLGSNREAAKMLGISIPTFSKYLGYQEEVPKEIKQLVADKKVSVYDARRLSQIVPDTEKAVKFGNMIAKLPKPKRERYFTTIMDDPKIPLNLINEKSKQYAIKNIVKVYLPDNYARALGKAAIQLNAEPESLGQKAIMDWLENEGWIVNG
jgi:ParB family chromosome partitioning protein